MSISTSDYIYRYQISDQIRFMQSVATSVTKGVCNASPRGMAISHIVPSLDMRSANEENEQDSAMQQSHFDLDNIHGLFLRATTFCTEHSEYGLCARGLWGDLVSTVG